DHGPAVRTHRPVQVCHRTVGRRRNLSFSSKYLAARGRTGARAPLDHVRRPSGIVRAAPGREAAVGRGFRFSVRVRAARIGGDRALAREAEYFLRDVAPHAYRPRDHRRDRRASAYGRVEFLPGRPLEAGSVDRPDDLLDRVGVLRSAGEAAVHAPTPLPGNGGAPGARRHDDPGDAPGRSPRFPLQGQFGWLTVWGSPFKITAH